MSFRFRQLIPLLAAAACVGESPPESATPDAATAAKAAAPAAPPSDVIAGELIVQLDQPLTVGVATELGGHRVVPVMVIAEGTWLVRLDATAARAAMPLPELTMVAIADVARVPGVRYAHPNQRLEFSRTPNDEYAFEQGWHHAQIRLYEAWDLITGPINSNDVRIAVIDTGRTNHLDSVWASGANFIASPPTTDAINPFSYHHGVMVAGLIGARTDNGTGVAGVCWNCSIIPIRGNFGDDGMDTAAVAAGLRWAAGLRDLAGMTTSGPLRAQVANLSFNSGLASATCDGNPTLRDAIIDATAAGLTVVASSGNHSFTTGPSFPANCPGAIAVAASNRFDAVASYSDRGMGIDLTAPGGGFPSSTVPVVYLAGHGTAVPTGTCGIESTDTGGIVSTWTQPDGTHCYRQSAGTSFASPHVSGVIGLMLAARSSPTLTPAQIRAVLRLTASASRTSGLGFICPSNACGAGRLDARAAVDAIDGGTPAIAEVSPTFVDFGTVTSSPPRTVTLRNIGLGDSLSSASAMTITGGAGWFRFSGSCSGQSCNQNYSLLTNQSASIAIVCQPTGAGTQTAELIYNHTGVGKARVQLSCTGTVTGNLSVASPLVFGNVLVNTTGAANLTLSNLGTGPLTITSSVPPTGVFSLGSALPSTIAAGGSSTVQVRCTPTSEGTFAGSLTINSTGGNRTVNLTCTGIMPRLVLSPTSIDHGNVRVGATSDAALSLSNPGGAPLTVALSVGGSTFGVISSLQFTIAPNTSATVIVRCMPPSLGLHTSSLSLSTNAGNFNVPLACTGATSGIAVSPTALDFGVVEVGGRGTGTVMVTSTGAAPLAVTSIVASGGAFSIADQAITLPPGASAGITPRCSPTAVGTVTGWIEVRSDAGDRRVDLTCTGGRAQLAAVTWIDLPDVLLGGETTAPLQLSNPGNVPLTITSATITGSGLSFTDLPTTIAPGATATVTLRCSPRVVGHVTGSLQLTSNAVTSLTSIGIGCRAAEGRITVLAGANLALGWCDSDTVTIQNSGVGPLLIDELRFTESGMSASGIALPRTLAAGEIASWQVSCDCWRPSFNVFATQSAKHDGVQDGPLGTVECLSEFELPPPTESR